MTLMIKTTNHPSDTYLKSADEGSILNKLRDDFQKELAMAVTSQITIPLIMDRENKNQNPLYKLPFEFLIWMYPLARKTDDCCSLYLPGNNIEVYGKGFLRTVLISFNDIFGNKNKIQH